MLSPSIAAAYEENRFFDAWMETKELYADRDRLAALDTASLILLGRLAHRLGSPARSRLLFYAAKKRAPADPYARYFAMRLTRRSMLQRLENFQRDVALFAGIAELEAAWCSEHAVIAAGLQDFETARASMRRALELQPDDPFVRAMYAMALLSEGERPAALEAAEASWRASPGRPACAGALAATLSALGRSAEAASRLTAFAERSRQSFEVAMTAAGVSILAAKEEAPRHTLALMPELERLAPLADNTTKRGLASLGLEVARRARDLAAAKKYASAIRSPFHEKLLARIEANPNGARVVLPYRFSRQGQAECLPASLSTCLGVFGVELDLRALAEKMTFGGTAMWRAAEWAEANGYIARSFIAEPGVAVQLIEAGVPFVLIIPGLDESHACAVVGVDHATGSLLVHDPNHDGLAELMLDTLGEADAPFGPRALLVIPRADAGRVASIALPYEREEAASAALDRLMEKRSDAAAQAQVIDRLEAEGGSREHVELLRAAFAAYRGESATATAILDRLTLERPKAISLEVLRLRVLRAVGNTARLRETLARLVDASTFESATDRPSWFHGHPLLRVEYAATLAGSAEYRREAERQLESALFADPGLARAYELLGRLRLGQGDAERALLPLRLASSLKRSDDGAARSYVQALLAANREQEAIVWLERRIEHFASHELAAPTWLALIDLYHALGRADEALEQLGKARAHLSGDATIAACAVDLLARRGQLAAARAALADLERYGSPSLHHSSAIALARIERRFDDAMRHADAWIEEEPRSVAARTALIELVFERRGPAAALELAEKWSEEGGDQELHEQQLLEALKHAGDRPRRITLLERRIAKNALDAWAHREVALEYLARARTAPLAKRTETLQAFAGALARCELSSPDHPLTVVMAGELATLERDHGRARLCFAKAVELAPEEGRWMILYADAAKKSGADPAQVIADLDRALSRVPGARRCFLAAATAVRTIATPRRARAFVADWRARAPDDAELAAGDAALRTSELTARGGEDLDRATAELERLAARAPAHAGLRGALADLYVARNDLSGALRQLATALALEPDDLEPRKERARIHLLLEQHEEALAELRVLVDVAPLSEAHVMMLAALLGELHRTSEATEVLREAAQRLPSSVRIAEQLADLHRSSGRPRDAAEALEALHRRRPDDAAVLVIVALARAEHAAPGSGVEAEKLLETALLLEASDWRALDALFELYLGAERHSEARALLEQYREAVDDPSWAIRREATLARAEKGRPAALALLHAYLETHARDAASWSLYLSWLGEANDRLELEAAIDKIPLTAPELARAVAQGIFLLIALGAPRERCDALWPPLGADGIHTFEVELDYGRYLLVTERPLEALEVAQRFGRSPIARALSIEALLRLDRKDEARAVLRESWCAISNNASHMQLVLQLFAAAQSLDEAFRDGIALIEEGRVISRSTLEGAFYAAVQARSAASLADLASALAVSRRAPELVPVIAQALELLLQMKAPGLVLALEQKHRKLVEANTLLWMEVARARFASGDKHGTKTQLASWRGRDQVPMRIALLHAVSAVELGWYKEAVESCVAGLALVPQDGSMRGLANVLLLAHLHEQITPFESTVRGSQPFLEAWNRFGELLSFEPEEEHPTSKMFLLFARMLKAATRADLAAADRAFRRFQIRFRDQCGWAAPLFLKWLLPKLPWWQRIWRWLFG